MKLSITVKLLDDDGKATLFGGGVTLDEPTLALAIHEATAVTKRVHQTMRGIRVAIADEKAVENQP